MTVELLVGGITAIYILAMALVVWVTARLSSKISSTQQTLTTTQQQVLDTLAQRDESGRTVLLAIQQMLHDSLQQAANAQKSQLEQISTQLGQLSTLTEIKLERIREVVEQKLSGMTESSERKLEQIRHMVDEKLHETLEKRLGESFKLVSERLEIVHRGLGEMQSLATGVGDLKRVLSNVKTRGIWGEVQLEAIITQIMTPAQYDKNVAVVPGSNERVEFAVRLPNKEGEQQQVWLPIDAKCPLDYYHKLLEAQEGGDIEEIALAYKALIINIKRLAKSVSDKYIKPPFTTDFAIIFLPIEAMYAEVLRHAGLIETLQQEYHVVLTSPTTLSAILNSLQMGFRTLAIEQRSGEVWKLLGSVKTEFVKFADILSKTKIKLDQASKVIGDVEIRSRAIQRHLRSVESSSDPEPILFGPVVALPEDIIALPEDEVANQ